MGVQTVLFDIGGVLTPDPWETLLFHSEHGLLRTSDLRVEQAAALVGPVWGQHAETPAAIASTFWSGVAAALGVQIDPGAIAAIAPEVITANPESEACFAQLRARRLRIGIISNNTPFFYPRQAEVLRLASRVDPWLIFLSHERRCSKSNGLFDVAAEHIDPSQTLVIDDRIGNLHRAAAAGFDTLYYDMATAGSLLAAVTEALEHQPAHH